MSTTGKRSCPRCEDARCLLSSTPPNYFVICGELDSGCKDHLLDAIKAGTFSKRSYVIIGEIDLTDGLAATIVRHTEGMNILRLYKCSASPRLFGEIFDSLTSRGLISITIEYADLGDIGTRALHRAISRQNPSKPIQLTLVNCNVSYEYIASTFLEDLDVIGKLSLNADDMEPQDYAAFARFTVSGRCKLHDLRFRGGKIGTLGACAFSDAFETGNFNLLGLEFSFCGIGGAESQLLTRNLHLTKTLETFAMCGSSFDGPFCFKSTAHICRISLSSSAFSETAIESLAGYLATPEFGITNLMIVNSSGFDENGIRVLAGGLAKNRWLNSLYFSPRTKDVSPLFDAMRENRTLTTLSWDDARWSNNIVPKEDLKHLAAVLRDANYSISSTGSVFDVLVSELGQMVSRNHSLQMLSYEYWLICMGLRESFGPRFADSILFEISLHLMRMWPVYSSVKEYVTPEMEEKVTRPLLWFSRAYFLHTLQGFVTQLVTEQEWWLLRTRNDARVSGNKFSANLLAITNLYPRGVERTYDFWERSKLGV